MGHQFLDLLRGYLEHYGYWAVAVALLLENSGLPVPGETILLLASFVAYSEGELRLPWIIAVGIVAATTGDNIGYALGRRGGRPLLDRYRHWFRIPDKVIARGEHLFARYGPVTILAARFLFGLRVIAGPLAGVLRMEWRRFAIFNFLGATLWVTVIAVAGYLFGRHWATLVHAIKEFDIAIAILAGAVVLWLWWRRRAAASK
jgi:membrane protein DedA with SNARE-associated domain